MRPIASVAMMMTLLFSTQAFSQEKPSILVVWGDDIGNTNISANTHGLMGYRTPNIDRIAREGMRFTDYYTEQSCTAGRSPFILGQSVYRSGLNGVHMNTWPDGGMTPFRSEKNTNWEGAMRVPAFVRWPGNVKAGSVTNEIVHHMDWMPTLAAVAGEPKVKEKLLTGYEADGRTYKVHLDGYNQLPLLTGKTDKSPRKEIFYFSDDGDLTALRYSDWKLVFMEQKTEETLRIWMEPFVPLRIPLIINLRRDPYERGMKTSNTYLDWLLDRAYLLVPAQAYVGRFLETFKEYPPRMKAASFSLDQVMKKLEESSGSK